MKITVGLFFLLLCVVASPLSAAAQTPKPKEIAKSTPLTQSQDASAQIRAVLDAQVAAWNAGKLEEFMTGYWRSPELTFYSGGQKLAGWDATLARYRRTYQAEGKEMGKLQFSELQIEPLGAEAAVVRGRWGLTMAEGKTLGGLYTLIFRRFKDGWKIVHDHTSAN
jgi:ketosteroid isomerase-like protein